jgi:dihydropteroate synthase
MYWQCRNIKLDCNAPLIMGILNITPDSFSDGGRFFSPDSAIAAARRMLDDGADIIDIGGESTRPGSEPVSVDDELQRVIPVVEALSSTTDAVISIDTSKAAVARTALECGAHIINDVSAMTADISMPQVIADFSAGIVLMHMRETPRTMQDNPDYDDVVMHINSYLAQRIKAALAAGIPRENIAIDPGFGFGKTTEHNIQLLAELHSFKKHNTPLLVGLSRKRFIGTLSGMPVDERLPGSLAGLTCAVINGADIIRVHDVAQSQQAAAVATAVRNRMIKRMPEEKHTC